MKNVDFLLFPLEIIKVDDVGKKDAFACSKSIICLFSKF